tara:strand:- start:90 stop:425 length:336 start_codon:yes stop_codon:yes gene_type:complete
MSNSWDKYFEHYSDWDDAHRFHVRIELEFEGKIKNLGYIEEVISDEIFVLENKFGSNILPKCKTYTKTKNEISLSFAVPYDWSIDTDWEDKALVLLGLSDEWVIDSSVEDN